MTKLKIKNKFSSEFISPENEISWEKRSTEITSDAGKTIFKQEGVEIPKTWSPLATKIAVSKYFYGDISNGIDPTKEGRESSIKQLVSRVTETIAKWGMEDGYFESEKDSETFGNELKWLCLNQYGAFNSPVWFNVGLYQKYGVDGGQTGNWVYDKATDKAAIWKNQYEYPQASACFIQSVDDTMESIMKLAYSEAMLFKYGSGTGSDLSTIRSTKEKLSGGGKPSGPMSFLKIYDQVAGTVKSGGKTRRAAKMNTLKTSHPDIEEFIDAKAKEERKAWTLIDAGYDGSFNGDAYGSVMYQNENLSVRADDAFMNAAVENKPYFTLAVKDGKPIEEKNAGVLMTKIAEGTYVCGDPGMQFDDTIHKWHTCKGTARQNSTNPCSEYLFLDNTACNLASLNLIKFKAPDGSFDCDRFVAACRIFITAQEILVDRASYPTKEIAENSHIFRTLGLGFANLGALIMSLGLAYDSNEGRAIAGAITSLMTSTAYHQSSLIASFYGEFPGYHNAKCSGISNPLKPSNQESMLEVIALHKEACEKDSNGSVVWEAAKAMWAEAYHIGKIYGYRNAQVTVLAPTGTIGFLMDCDTTGIEPDIALVKYKLLAGGGNLKIVNQSVEPALVTLGYTEAEIAKIIRHIDIYDTIEDIGTYGEIAKSGLLSSHLVVFDCAFKAAKGSRSLHYMGHLKMMAACQPFLSGAISKTVNLPESATIDDIRNAYIDGWKMGLKAIAVYRDGSKRSAPLSTKTESKEVAVVDNDELEELRSYIVSLEANCESPVRKRLPDTRNAINHKFEIAGHKGYLSVGLFDNGDPGEIFISMSKEGSTIGGLVDTVATLTSLSLQYGVPLKDLVNKFAYQRFEPSGFTKNPDIRNATSIIDYVFRWLGCQFVEGYKKETPLLDKAQTTTKALSVNVASSGYLSDPCSNCGSSKVIRSGVCGVCTECGTSQGCS